eukprot:Phypoly_transcript_05585.p1 GENE.Phypoly_transcript_05585~~Phypoly_transcript_05585.p1  ORF type:complete len:355 (-),score=80.24 Phypoly_transcript_05585:775-1839(-)
MSRVASTNRYCINLHDTLSQETTRNNGKDLITHFVVVKNTPFLINISSKDSSVNFRKTKITATLIYDCEPRREVSLLRSSPLEYVTHLSSNGELITIEARIHVLTSQNENSLFRVNLKFNDEELLSEPLKVISKADNLKKPSQKSTNNSNKKKRNASDAFGFGDTLQRIEQQQQEQKNLIDMLYQQNQLLMTQLQAPPSPQHSVPSTPQHSSPSPSPSFHSVPSPELPISSPSSTDSSDLSSERDFHTCVSALRTFLNCYKSYTATDRPHKVRLLNDSLSTEQQDALSCLTTNVLQVQNSTGDSLALPSMDMFEDHFERQFSAMSSPEHDGLSNRGEVSTLLGSWLDVIDDRTR